MSKFGQVFWKQSILKQRFGIKQADKRKDCEADLSIFGSYIPSDEWHARTTTYLFRHARANFKLLLIFYSRNLSNHILNAWFECHRKWDIYNYVIFEFSETTGAIHSTKILTGATGKRGPPQKVDPFFRNFSGWTEPIHWVLDRNFRKFWLNGSRPTIIYFYLGIG